MTQAELLFEKDTSLSAKRFRKFHSENPAVYEELIRLARQFRRKRPSAVIGMKMLYEVLRWNFFLATTTDEPYKLSNDFTPFYARLIMENEPDLKGIFNLRGSIADEGL